MKSQHKLILVILAIVFALLLPYFIWHEQMDAYFASESYQEWLVSVKPYAWLIGIALIVGDLFLPIPTPPIMAAMGTLYGTFTGGLIATVGSILAGLTAYGLARLLGMKAARFLAGKDELDDLQTFFDSWGAVGIISSRALPVLPEVLTLLAGLAKMHFGRFMLSLTLGAIPVGLAFAWVGETSGVSSSLLLILTLIPACAWCAYMAFAAARRKKALPVPCNVSTQEDQEA